MRSIEEQYKRLYDEYIKGLRWNTTRLEDAAIFTSMKGKDYKLDNPIRLMIIGRAPNGWGEDGVDISDSNSFSQSIIKLMDSDDRFSWYKEEKEKGYRSAFWRVSEGVFRGLTMSKRPDWEMEIVWSNLYKIARNGEQRNLNPTNYMCRLQLEPCKKILEEEITLYMPTHILLITGMDWINNKDYSFEYLFNLSVPKEPHHFVEGIGTTVFDKKIRVVVANRPDSSRNMKNHTEKEYVDEVVEWFNKS